VGHLGSAATARSVDSVVGCEGKVAQASLAAPWSQEFTMILANPPFGERQNLLLVKEEGEMEKEEQVIVISR
jgi:hypothetical protein